MIKQLNIKQSIGRRVSIPAFIVLFMSLFLSNIGNAQTQVTDYTLGAGDVIRITVFGQNDLSFETRLSNIGTFKYPFLGDIMLVGKTVSEVEKTIDDGLRGDYLVNPSISVSVIEYRPFFIDGEVKRPGGYPYQPSLTVGKAAALAGGYTERAALNKPVTVRRNVTGSEASIELSNNDIVMPGDIITIPARFF